MQRLLALAFLASLILLSACNEETTGSEQTSNVPADQVAVTVNGTIISKDDVAQFKELKGGPHIPDDKIIEEMVATELLRQEALKAGIHGVQCVVDRHMQCQISSNTSGCCQLRRFGLYCGFETGHGGSRCGILLRLLLGCCHPVRPRCSQTQSRHQDPEERCRS